MIFLRSITEASFEVCLSEPAPRNGSHPAMEVNFVAVSPGVHLLPDGRVVEAGRVQTLQRQAADCRPLDFPHRGWEWVSFLHPFQVPPTCLVMMQTLNNAVTHVPMTPWLVAAIGGINSTGMEVALDSMKNTEDGTVNSPEEIGYIAFDSQPYTNSAEILADSPASPIQYVIMTTGTLPYMGWGDGDRSEQYVSFTRTFPQASSVVVVAGQGSRNAPDGAWLRHFETNAATARIFADENDAEVNASSAGPVELVTGPWTATSADSDGKVHTFDLSGGVNATSVAFPSLNMFKEDAELEFELVCSNASNQLRAIRVGNSALDSAWTVSGLDVHCSPVSDQWQNVTVPLWNGDVSYVGDIPWSDLSKLELLAQSPGPVSFQISNIAIRIVHCRDDNDNNSNHFSIINLKHPHANVKDKHEHKHSQQHQLKF
ncbi:unnamed protein product [Symbiodinium necroappetens]|uniref:Uncharacterized protein n=1 Tax=Symbiodinium necroappetens TaxID=1628268 RepID=A0A812WQL4_9DINO|nr:unnamed protein product [Symbiodinium necroappetens]